MHVDGGRREAHLGAEDPLERDEREEEHRVDTEWELDRIAELRHESACAERVPEQLVGV